MHFATLMWINIRGNTLKINDAEAIQGHGGQKKKVFSNIIKQFLQQITLNSFGVHVFSSASNIFKMCINLLIFVISGIRIIMTTVSC